MERTYADITTQQTRLTLKLTPMEIIELAQAKYDAAHDMSNRPRPPSIEYSYWFEGDNFCCEIVTLRQQQYASGEG